MNAVRSTGTSVGDSIAGSSGNGTHSPTTDRSGGTAAPPEVASTPAASRREKCRGYPQSPPEANAASPKPPPLPHPVPHQRFAERLAAPDLVFCTERQRGVRRDGRQSAAADHLGRGGTAEDPAWGWPEMRHIAVMDGGTGIGEGAMVCFDARWPAAAAALLLGASSEAKKWRFGWGEAPLKAARAVCLFCMGGSKLV